MMNKVKPLTPGEVTKQADKGIPDEVFQAINELIVKHYRGSSASFTFKEAAALVATKLGITSTEVYERHLLDVEEHYKKAGWRVLEDKPGFNETYEGNWTFTKATRGG